MEQALFVTRLFYNILGGMGLFFMGVGVLWFVTIYKARKE